MNSYGIEAHTGEAHPAPERAPSRYLVVIGGADGRVARLFDASRLQVTEFDAGAEEVLEMTRGLHPTRTANLPEWDQALAGHDRAERESADVFTLPV